MALVRDTALLTSVADVLPLTGVSGLSNLEADQETSVAGLLLEAHRWVFDRLARRLGGSAALALLSNQAALHRAEAYRFMETLAANGLVAGGGERATDEGARDYWGNQAREEVDSFQPEFSDSRDSARKSSEGLPCVGHNTELVFGDPTIDDLPAVRREGLDGGW